MGSGTRQHQFHEHCLPAINLHFSRYAGRVCSRVRRFYLPGQPRTYAQDIFGQKALQFDYFLLASDLKGETGILVLSDQDQGELDLAHLAPFFDRCDLADKVQTQALGKHTRRVEIYRCTNYRGHPPREAAGDQPD